MDLAKPPFYSDSFFHYSHFRAARQQFLEQTYVGKTVIFNCDLIGISGRLIHATGDIAKIIAIDCDMFKLETVLGEDIYGLFNPACLTLVT